MTKMNGSPKARGRSLDSGPPVRSPTGSTMGSSRKTRGRTVSIKKSKVRLLSIPAMSKSDPETEEEMYYSEPELFERSLEPIRVPTRAASVVSSGSPAVSRSEIFSRSNSGLYFAPFRASSHPTPGLKPEVSREPSIGPSEDEDGVLFKTLTSEGADQVREAAFAMASAPASPVKRTASLPAQPPISVGEQIMVELGGVPECGNFSRLPQSLLRDYAQLPIIIEYVINHGILVCLSGLLYELTFMPVSALRGLYKSVSGKVASHIEKSDLVRTSVLVAAVILFNASIDFSAVYHYVRAQSLLKLYFIFNMLEILERLVRSWGNDLVDGLVKTCVTPHSKFTSIISHWVIVVVYTLVHAYMHFWRVMIISVAILTNDIMIVLVTNNFNEVKGTVFKKTEPRSVYPIISSDIVERLYLFLDIALVLFRMATSPQRSKMPFSEVTIWAGVMIGLEIATDWLKFLCISKFNQIDNATYWHYARIHKDDLLNSRNTDANPIPPLVQKGFVAASHLPVRRMNFMPTPLAVLVLCNVMLPNLVGAETISLWTYRALVVLFLFIGKLTLDWVLVGDSNRSDRSMVLPEKLQNIRSL